MNNKLNDASSLSFSLLFIKELALLDKLTLHTIANGNTVNPVAYEPTLEEYKMLHQIRAKLFQEA